MRLRGASFFMRAAVTVFAGGAWRTVSGAGTAALSAAGLALLARVLALPGPAFASRLVLLRPLRLRSVRAARR